MQVAACTSFLIGTSTKGTPMAAAEIDFPAERLAIAQ
jgi:hypothetical protein